MTVIIGEKTYEVINGKYYLVATYGLASQISGMDPSDTENKILTKEYVSNTGCQIVSNPVLTYTDTMCVLYQDLEVDEDIMLDGDEHSASMPAAHYTTTDGLRIIPNDTSWYLEPDPNLSDYDPAGSLYYSNNNSDFEMIASGAFLCINTLTSYKTTYRCSIIGSEAFRNCQNLKSIEIRSSDTENKYCSIGNYAFADCTKLKNLIIGSNVSRSVQSTFISDYVFDGCSALSNIRGHDNIATIGKYAFSGCSLLNVLTLVNCTSFGDYAFNGCTGLNSVLLRGSATYGSNVFNGCNNISTVHFIDSTNGDGWINAIKSIPNYDDGHLTVYIPNSTYDISELTGVRFIEYDANPENGSAKVVIKTGNFMWYSGTIEDRISETDLYPSSNAAPPALRCARIYGWLKYNLNTLTSTECERITNINFDTDYQVNPHIGLEEDGGHNKDTYYPKEDDGLTSFDEFQYFTNLHAHKIQDELFSDFEYLTSIKLPQNIEIIGNRAFTYCSSLTSITIPNSVTSIGDYAFGDCSSLTLVTLNSNTIVSKDYDYPSIIHHPEEGHWEAQNTIIWIGDTTGGGTLGEGWTPTTNACQINTQASYLKDQYQCAYRTSSSSGYVRFSHEQLVLTEGDEITFICWHQSNSSERDIYLYINDNMVATFSQPKSSTESNTFVYAIPEDTNIESVRIQSSGSSNFMTYEVRYVTNVWVVDVPAWDEVVTLPQSNIKSIFGDQVTEYIIGNDVTSIGDNAFYGCDSLTSLTIGNSVTSIGDNAFDGCASLTSITIPNSVISIEGGAFYGCTGLTSVNIPSNVTNIGSDAFYGCTSVTDVYFNWSSEAELQGVTWTDANEGDDFAKEDTIIHIPSGMLSYYKTWAPAWEDYFRES